MKKHAREGSISENRARELAFLYQLGNSLASGKDLFTTFLTLQTEILNLIQADALYIAIYDWDSDLVEYPIFFEAGRPQIHPSRLLTQNPGLTGAVIFNRQTLYLPNIMLDEVQGRYAPVDDNDFTLHTFLGIPLVVNEKVIGALSVQSTKVDAYSQEQVQLVENVAVQAAFAIDKASLLDRLKRELTERKHLVEELEAKNRELERFAYTVSHDLKTPLVTISGFLSYLEQSAVSGNMERHKQDLQRIQGAVLKMSRLLDELLLLSRIGRVTKPPETLLFDLLAHEAFEIAHGTLKARGIPVRIQPGLPSVFGDRARLVEVLQNLLDNAAKFMGSQPNPVIEIGARGEEQGMAVFFVRDNGIGIPPEYHEQIFGIFNKLDPANRRFGDRTGHRPAHHRNPWGTHLGRERAGHRRYIPLRVAPGTRNLNRDI